MKLANSSKLSEALILYSRMRSVNFAIQYWILNCIAVTLGHKIAVNYSDSDKLRRLHDELRKLLEQDILGIEKKYYPISVLKPNGPFRLLQVLPKVLWDTIRVAERRSQRKSEDFTDSAKKYFDELPDYYLRNFHFQTDGYLSKSSAEVYEYEVELLFSGAADAMRRLIIIPLKKFFPDNPDGQGLKFLEVGVGTGRATRFVKLAFPRAKIYGVDLSQPYLKLANRNLSEFESIHLLQGSGADLTFKNCEFNAVYSVFLFHEMPNSVRLDTLKESMRVLKPGGFLGLVDSLQIGDFPDFDQFLEDFPKTFHEPFYIDYIRHPLKGLLDSVGLEDIQAGTGFLSKFLFGKKTLIK